jgi:hypothetical protein
MYATGVGLLIHATRQASGGRLSGKDVNLFAKVCVRMKNWFMDFF